MDIAKVAELLQLSLDERLQLVEELWESVAAEAESRPDALPLTPAQRDEIRRRSALHRANPGEASALDDALQRIDSALD